MTTRTSGAPRPRRRRTAGAARGTRATGTRAHVADPGGARGARTRRPRGGMIGSRADTPTIAAATATATTTRTGAAGGEAVARDRADTYLDPDLDLGRGDRDLDLDLGRLSSRGTARATATRAATDAAATARRRPLSAHRRRTLRCATRRAGSVARNAIAGRMPSRPRP